MNPLYLLAVVACSLNAINLEKYEEMYEDLRFLSKEITFFNSKAPVKINLPKLLGDFLAWKATEESKALLLDLNHAAMSVEDVVLRKK